MEPKYLVKHYAYASVVSVAAFDNFYTANTYFKDLRLMCSNEDFYAGCIHHIIVFEFSYQDDMYIEYTHDTINREN